MNSSYRISFLALVLLSLLAATCAAQGLAPQLAELQQYGIDLSTASTKLETLPPTPQGESYLLPGMENGVPVQLRFELPSERPLLLTVNLDNFVALSGQGTRYAITVRAHLADGPVVLEENLRSDGDAFNRLDLSHVDVTEFVREEDLGRGYLDLFVSMEVEGDRGTYYLDDNAGRDMYASATTPDSSWPRLLAARKQQAAKGVFLIPEPKELDFSGSDLDLAKGAPVVISAEAPRDELFAAQLVAWRLQERSFPSRVARWGPGEPLPDRAIVLARFGRDDALIGIARKLVGGAKLDVPDSPEGYWLATSTAGALAVGRGAAGLFYAAQTLRQLVPEKGDSLAGVVIKDWPDFPWRMVQYDLARGQTIDIEYMKRFISQLAARKINQLMIYMEDDFQFKAYPFLGRPGTMNAQKALELSEYAHKHQMQLIPQYESLGHAGAVLSHPELEQLREAGDAWVFCTSEPKTWEFLDTVMGELAEAFPYSPFIHIGGDEFEWSFGKCPRCKAYVEKQGNGALYALHMSRLNELVKKRGKQMLFWTAKGRFGPGEEEISLEYADLMPKDSIPFEWIYHGPSAYPTLAQYKEAGFQNLYACPSVVDYSRIWPDYPTTFRSIQTFYNAARAEGVRGVCCTTWELMYGALYENSWYGMIYSAEAAWNPATPPGLWYDRKFAKDWFGVEGEHAAELVRKGLYEAGILGARSPWGSSSEVSRLCWLPNQDFIERAGNDIAAARQAKRSLDSALQCLMELDREATRNQVTLRCARASLKLHELAADRLLLLSEIAQLYAVARKAEGEARWEALTKASIAAEELASKYAPLIGEYQWAVDNLGHYPGDVVALKTRQAETAELAGNLARLARERPEELPLAEEAGIPPTETYQVYEWQPNTMSDEEQNERLVDITSYLVKPGHWTVTFDYRQGAAGLESTLVELLEDGQVVARDAHRGWSGGSRDANSYSLELVERKEGAKYELRLLMRPDGGTDSRGVVHLTYSG